MNKQVQRPLDENGVPYLSREDIEVNAAKVLAFVDDSYLTQPCESPLAEICKKLQENHKVRFHFSCKLGVRGDGKKIVGQFCRRPIAILIDESVDLISPHGRFIWAHELGHLTLHRSLASFPGESAAPNADGDEMGDTEAEIVEDAPAKEVESKDKRDWIEWQANTFAACLLMPAKPVLIVVTTEMHNQGIVKNPGRLYVDGQPCNRKMFEGVLLAVMGIFKVSKTAATIRLKKVGLLEDQRSKPTRINDIGKHDR